MRALLLLFAVVIFINGSLNLWVAIDGRNRDNLMAFAVCMIFVALNLGLWFILRKEN